LCEIVKTAYNIAKYIWISKTIIVLIMVLSLTSSMAFMPHMAQRNTDTCESSHDRENDVPTPAVSVYTPTQSYSVAFNFKFADDFFFLFLDIKNSKCLSSLSNQFDTSISKYFVVLVRRIISPNGP